MALDKELHKLLEADIIDQPTADRIEAYYSTSKSDASSRLLVIFSVIGAFLIGLGIILIIAHNWDEIPKWTKTILAFVPLITGQGLCAYAVHTKDTDEAWSESSAVFLTLAVGASIALISQIYNLEGDLQGFLLIWLVLTLPVVYLMSSNIVSLLYFFGVGVFALMSIGTSDIGAFLISLGLFGAMIPFYVYMIKSNTKHNTLVFHHYIVPMSMTAVFSTLLSDNVGLGFIMLMGIATVYYMIGHSSIIRSGKLRNNGYLILGALGIVIILLIHTFSWTWDEYLGSLFSIRNDDFGVLLCCALLMMIASLGLKYFYDKKKLTTERPLLTAFLAFSGLAILGHHYPALASMLANFLLFGLSVLTIRAGISRDHLGVLNFGLLILTSLLICRFFDTDIPFVVRGILFIIVGVAFFVANKRLIQKRDIHD